MRRPDIVRKISESLRNLEELETYVYGSEARGEASSDSDIDLLILLPDSLSTKERIELEQQIHGQLLPIELSEDTEISPLILQQKVWNSRKTFFTTNVLNDRIRI